MTEPTGNRETELTPGLIGRREVLVCEHNVAPHVAKLSTPSMIRAMEQASQRAILDHLPPEQSTVGFEVNIRHVAGADIGATVVAVAELERVDGHWLYFKVEALDGDRTIGVGSQNAPRAGSGPALIVVAETKKNRRWG